MRDLGIEVSCRQPVSSCRRSGPHGSEDLRKCQTRRLGKKSSGGFEVMHGDSAAHIARPRITPGKQVIVELPKWSPLRGSEAFTELRLQVKKPRVAHVIHQEHRMLLVPMVIPPARRLGFLVAFQFYIRSPQTPQTTRPWSKDGPSRAGLRRRSAPAAWAFSPKRRWLASNSSPVM